MKYDVVWLRTAEHELAVIYNVAADKSDVTAAANELDRVLRRAPFQVSESRYDDMRIAFAKPLGITFRVLEQDQRVEVGHVWRY